MENNEILVKCDNCKKDLGNYGEVDKYIKLDLPDKTGVIMDENFEKFYPIKELHFCNGKCVGEFFETQYDLR